MPILDLAFIAETALKYARKFLYAALLVAFFSILVSIIAGFVVAFTSFYGLINSFIASISSGTGDVSKFFGLLNCVGFVSAFNDTKVLLFSAVLFLLFRILFAQVIVLYKYVLNAISPLVN